MLSYWPDYDALIDRKRDLSAAMLMIPARDEWLLRAVFGFNCPPLEFVEVAELWGRCRTRVYQIYRRALRRLFSKLRLIWRGHRQKCAVVPLEKFGTATPPLPRVKRYGGFYQNLAPFIFEMLDEGFRPKTIRERLVEDYNKAHWLNKSLPMSDYVPSESMICYISSYWRNR